MQIICELSFTVIEKYESQAFQYDLTEGFMPLREALVGHLANKQIAADADEIPRELLLGEAPHPHLELPRHEVVARTGGARVAAASGGLWKTTNHGLTWKPIFDREATFAIGDVDVSRSKPSVVWVGTGSACPRGNISIGDGVYRSTDAGRNWMHVGLPDAGLIGRIRVHPKDPDLVYVAALGHPYGENEERGVFRSRMGICAFTRRPRYNCGFLPAGEDAKCHPDRSAADPSTDQR